MSVQSSAHEVGVPTFALTVDANTRATVSVQLAEAAPARPNGGMLTKNYQVSSGQWRSIRICFRAVWTYAFLKLYFGRSKRHNVRSAWGASRHRYLWMKSALEVSRNAMCRGRNSDGSVGYAHSAKRR